MDHDHLFKELIAAFFREFIELFFPDVAALIDWDAGIVFLDKEIFTDISLGEKHELDLVAKVKIQGDEAFILIHTEPQSTAQSFFPERFYKYFMLLTIKYHLPVFPIALFSYDAPKRPEPTHYEVRCLGMTVSRFDYKVIQLNRIPWRRFLNQANPVASALMAKMKMTQQERPRVKLECLRMLATLKLDPARSRLIGVFADSYLKLTGAEMKAFERDFAGLEPAEREATMELMTSWERSGMEKGLEQGLEKGLLEGERRSLIRTGSRRFGAPDQTIQARLEAISTSDELGRLLDRLFDVESWNDLLA